MLLSNQLSTLLLFHAMAAQAILIPEVNSLLREDSLVALDKIKEYAPLIGVNQIEDDAKGKVPATQADIGVAVHGINEEVLPVQNVEAPLQASVAIPSQAEVDIEPQTQQDHDIPSQVVPQVVLTQPSHSYGNEIGAAIFSKKKKKPKKPKFSIGAGIFADADFESKKDSEIEECTNKLCKKLDGPVKSLFKKKKKLFGKIADAVGKKKDSLFS